MAVKTNHCESSYLLLILCLFFLSKSVDSVCVAILLAISIWLLNLFDNETEHIYIWSILLGMVTACVKSVLLSNWSFDKTKCDDVLTIWIKCVCVYVGVYRKSIDLYLSICPKNHSKCDEPKSQIGQKKSIQKAIHIKCGDKWINYRNWRFFFGKHQNFVRFYWTLFTRHSKFDNTTIDLA